MTAAFEFQVLSQLRDQGTAITRATHGRAGCAAGPVGVGMGGERECIFYLPKPCPRQGQREKGPRFGNF